MRPSEQPVCENCSPGDADKHPPAIKNTGCERAYELVDVCMKAHRGNVRDCKQEWEAFKACHKDQPRKGRR
ncbi:unnamed protein product [Discosporangium mesarthrocarpum]